MAAILCSAYRLLVAFSLLQCCLPILVYYMSLLHVIFIGYKDCYGGQGICFKCIVMRVIHTDEVD